MMSHNQKIILVVDGQGGGIGSRVVAALRSLIIKSDKCKNDPSCPAVIAVGTNSAATSAMLRAGADNAATGENALKVNARRADLIIGPIGIVVADSLLGEISPDMAAAVAQSPAKRILIPVNAAGCDNIVAGARDKSVAELVEDAVKAAAEAVGV